MRPFPEDARGLFQFSDPRHPFLVPNNKLILSQQNGCLTSVLYTTMIQLKNYSGTSNLAV